MTFGLCSLVVRKKRLEEGEDTLRCLQFERKQNSGVGRERMWLLPLVTLNITAKIKGWVGEKTEIIEACQIIFCCCVRLVCCV